jgi:CheY-like chemotaxis protein
VEDEPDTALSLAILLRRWGHEVEAVLDGRHALEVAVPFRPHVALMDLALPGMDGYEIAGRLQEAPALAGVWFIALSGYTREEGERRHPGGSGLFDLHLLKPVDPDQLRVILGRLAAQGAARSVAW